jgi:gamma-glutamylcyclotransferase (GGCT)/AIG2-like uncharacterized protein YtfP
MTETAGDRLFLYGSLRSDIPAARLPVEARVAAARLHGEAMRIGPGRIRGALCERGGYPALVEGDRDVVGEVWRLPFGSDLLAELDRYEGEDYARVRAQACLQDGRGVEVWVYRCATSPAPLVRLQSCDYLEWLSQSRR